MSETKTHTFTLKGPNNGEPWLVLGGATVGELEAAIQEAFPELEEHTTLPEQAWRAHALWSAVRAVVVGTTPAAQAPAQASAYQQAPQGGYGGSAPAQAAPGPQGAPGPSCAHGPRVYKEAKPGSGKSWKGWFCPAPMGTPDQCKPQFI